jgi:methionine-S-sulfoxide reductase
VGYAGGQHARPTYQDMGGHAETLQIDFDPARIDYAALLALFWQSHDATLSRPRQYGSIIFYHSDAQRKLAEATRDREAARRGAAIRTEIVAAGAFHRAEDYHQKYYLRREGDLLQELQKHYPVVRDLVDATSAARLNGYIGGFGSPPDLEADLERLGLSVAGQQRLRNLYAWRQPRD